MIKTLNCPHTRLFVPENTRELLVMSPLWYGMGYLLSLGTKAYQKRKREETEDRLLNYLLTSKTLCGWTEIAKGTTIYRNNIAPILNKLRTEGKIIKIGPHKKYGKNKNRDLDKIIRKSVYLPNIMNEHIKKLIEKTGFDVDEPHQASEIITINNQLVFEKSICPNCTTLETFVKQRRFHFESDIKEKPILANLYCRELGVALINLYNVCGYPPKENLERLG